MRCKACGMSFQRAAMLAMLIDLGCQTSDPNYCHETEDHEHDWVEAKVEAVACEEVEP